LVSIFNSMLPSAQFTAPNHICPGTCINFNNLSSNATSYLWNFPGGNPAQSTDVSPSNICYYNPGNYNVELIATNSNGSDTLLLINYITVYPFPPPQGIQQIGDTLFANAGQSTYQWYYFGNSIPGATNFFYVATASGDYNVVVTDANGCEVEAAINNVVAGVQQLPDPGSLLVVIPNPVTTTLDIQGLDKSSEYEITILNVLGEKVFSAAHCQMPIANCQFSSGLYYLEISSVKKTYRTKFLKE